MKLAIGLAVVLAACGGKKEDKAAPAPGSAIMTDDTMGKPMPGSGSGSAKKDMPPMPPPGQGMPDAGVAATKTTPETLEKRVEECWTFYNDSKYDDFKGCFALAGVNDVPGSGGPDLTPDQVVANLKSFKVAMPDQKGQVQLALASGNTVITIALLSGTQTGPMEGPAGTMPASGKKVGLYLAQLIELDDAGKITRESDYFDGLTIMGQLQPDKFKDRRPALDKLAFDKDVAIAKGDDTEKANLAAVDAFYAAFDKHDAKATLATLADDVSFYEQASPPDLDKKGFEKDLPEIWKRFADLKLTPTKKWAAGAYVAVVHTWEASKDTKKASLPMLAIYKLDGGKLKRGWLFYQSAALLQQLGLPVE